MARFVPLCVDGRWVSLANAPCGTPQKKRKKKKKTGGAADAKTLKGQKHSDKKDFGPEGGTPGVNRYGCADGWSLGSCVLTHRCAPRDEERRDRRKKKRDAKSGDMSSASERKERRKERRRKIRSDEPSCAGVVTCGF